MVSMSKNAGRSVMRFPCRLSRSTPIKFSLKPADERSKDTAKDAKICFHLFPRKGDRNDPAKSHPDSHAKPLLFQA